MVAEKLPFDARNLDSMRFLAQKRPAHSGFGRRADTLAHRASTRGVSGGISRLLRDHRRKNLEQRIMLAASWPRREPQLRKPLNDPMRGLQRGEAVVVRLLADRVSRALLRRETQ